MSGHKRIFPSVVDAKPATATKARKRTNQQSPNQSISQSSNQSNNNIIDLTTANDAACPRGRPRSRPVNQSVRQPVNEPIGHPVDPSINPRPSHIFRLLDLPIVLQIEIVAYFRLAELNVFRSVNQHLSQLLSYTSRSHAVNPSTSILRSDPQAIDVTGSINQSSFQSNNQSVSPSAVRSSVPHVDIRLHWNCLSLHESSFGPPDHEQRVSQYSRFHPDAESNMFMCSTKHNDDIDRLLAAGPYPRVTIVRMARWTVNVINLQKLIASCPNLSTLYVSHSSQNADNFLEVIASKLPHLTGLHVDMTSCPHPQRSMFPQRLAPLTALSLVEFTLHVVPLSNRRPLIAAFCYQKAREMRALRYVNVEADSHSAFEASHLPCPSSLTEAHYPRLEIIEDLMWMASQAPNLRILGLTRGENRVCSRNPEFRGNVPIQSNLMELGLKNFVRLSVENLKQFIHVYPSIRYLDLSCSLTVGASMLTVVLGEMPELRSLDLARCSRINDTAWIGIKPNKLVANQLKYLNIECDSSDDKEDLITEKGVKHIAQLFPCLRSLNVAYHFGVGSEGLNDIMSLPFLHTLNASGTKASLGYFTKALIERPSSKLRDLYLAIGQCYQGAEQRATLSVPGKEPEKRRLLLGVQCRNSMWRTTDYRVHLHVAVELEPQEPWDKRGQTST